MQKEGKHHQGADQRKYGADQPFDTPRARRAALERPLMCPGTVYLCHLHDGWIPFHLGENLATK